MAFLKKFPDDDARWQHLEKVRWPDGPVCAKCGNVGPTMARGRKHYHQCKACNAKFTAAFERLSKAHTCRCGRDTN